MKSLSGILNIVGNKYLLSLTVFLVWISFFDRNDLFTQYDRKQELKKLETSKGFYEQEIKETQKNLTELNNDPAILEKMARENFFMKRNGEEVFIVIDSNENKNKLSPQ